MVSGPGTEVFSKESLPESFSRGVQLRGGHIVVGDHDEPDITVCINRNEETCDFHISEIGDLRFNLRNPVKTHNKVVRVLQG